MLIRKKIIFLYHIILCYGKVECEGSTFRISSLMDTFRGRGLISAGITQEAIDHFVRAALLGEHCWLPIQNRELERHIKETKKSLTMFFCEQSTFNIVSLHFRNYDQRASQRKDTRCTSQSKN